MTRYIVTAVVDADSLGALLNAALPHIAEPFQVTPEIVQAAPRKRDASRDTPSSQTRCGAAAIEALRTGPCTLLEVSSYLEQRGFSQNSSSPILSKLIQERLVVRGQTSLNGVQTRIYTLTEAGAAAGARGAGQ